MDFSSELFVARFTELCNQKGMSPRKALSKVFGMDVSNLVKWRHEESIPKANLILAVAEYFDVSTDYLLGRTDNSCISQEQMTQEEKEMLRMLRLADAHTQELALAAMKAILQTEHK